LKKHIYAVISQKVVEKIHDFFIKLFATNRWIRFDDVLLNEEAVIFLLHFLVRYWPEREYVTQMQVDFYKKQFHFFNISVKLKLNGVPIMNN